MIVIGHELNFWQQALLLERHLRIAAGLLSVQLCEGWKREEWDMHREVRDAANAAGKDPFLLAYIGHGYRDATGAGWAYGMRGNSVQLRLPYEALMGILLQSRQGPTLVLNDCCHAGAFPVSVDPEHPASALGLIAASTAEGTCRGDLLSDLIAAWTRRDPYEPRVRVRPEPENPIKEIRRGQVLDHHFFAQPTAA